MALPQEAAGAEDMLRNDTQLLQVRCLMDDPGWTAPPVQGAALGRGLVCGIWRACLACDHERLLRGLMAAGYADLGNQLLGRAHWAQRPWGHCLRQCRSAGRCNRIVLGVQARPEKIGAHQEPRT